MKEGRGTTAILCQHGTGRLHRGMVSAVQSRTEHQEEFTVPDKVSEVSRAVLPAICDEMGSIQISFTNFTQHRRLALRIDPQE